MWIVIGAVVLLGCGTAYAAPKIKDYLTVNGAISDAKQLQASGNYTGALAKLNGVDGMWMLSSTRQNVGNLEKQESGFVQDQNNYDLAISEESSSTTNAQSLLQSIPTDYPQYGQVQTALNSVASQIEGQLKAQAQQAQAQVQAAQAAKAQAEASAAEAAQAKAVAQAQAAALAEQEQQAQEEAQQEQEQAQQEQQQQAQAQAAQMRQTAINQLQSIYNTFENDGIADYNEGMDEFNAGLYSESINYFSEAIASFKSVGDSLTQMSNSYTNLDSDIAGAMVTLDQAVSNCMDACVSVVGTIGGTSNSANTNLYSDTCNSDKNTVAAFLSSQ
jgi:flagellar biosynthesis GTPase FlhF